VDEAVNYILILFMMLPNQTTASVRVGFTSQETCVEGAKVVAANLKANNPGATVDWSCIKQ
jgi:hypothetical protein